ncbi:MAG: polyketide cyclase [Rhodospirillaceae bacterium]|nr:polyketide cyclase [Rhodospirillaceae bacterium]
MDFRSLLDAFTAAVVAGDGKGLAALFTEDGVYHDGFYGAFAGREAIRQMLEERFHRDAGDFQWAMRDPVSDGRLGYAWYRFSYRPKVGDTGGERVVFEGISRFRIEDGRIAHYDEVFDSGIAMTQLGFPPERIAKSLVKRAKAVREATRS